ncbi:MAG: thiamine pyrophosphate-binding protein [Bacteroidales bacterium]|jgi:acetolactate synthase-1/2/3 large subunit|nr:thiamine pyrophosphate-binding protein [Bacteroidales bacterium]MBQ3983014.1 thiamine pyrophosphate-binding protein [Bacteroidales bacterium]
MIFSAKYHKPIFLVGTGVRSAGAVQLVHQFVKKTNIPLLTTMNGVDLAQDDLHIGFIGTHGNRVANMMLRECDLIVSVGARLSLRQVGRHTANFAPQAHLVRCDIDENELSRNIKENEQKFSTDAADFMRMLLAEEVGDYSAWRQQCLEAKAVLAPYDRQPGNCAVEAIAALLPPNPNVSVDVGMHQCWCAQSLVLKGYDGRIHISGGYGTMGCGLPFAIGSSIAMQGGKVYCIAGDGGFQMNIQELQTIQREQLPVKIFILNNRVLGKISETQHFNHGDRFAATAVSGGYTVPEFTQIAQAYGIKAVKLSSYQDLGQYAQWVNDNEPCLFDIALPEDSLLTPKIKWETGKISPAISQDVVNQVEEILKR